MKLESIEQADSEIRKRCNDLRAWSKTYKVELPFDMLSNALDGRRPNPQYFARTAYRLGQASVSTNISQQLLAKAGMCLIKSKLATWEEPIFYPSMAGPLQKFDELIQMFQDLNQLEYNL